MVCRVLASEGPVLGDSKGPIQNSLSEVPTVLLVMALQGLEVYSLRFEVTGCRAV